MNLKKDLEQERSPDGPGYHQADLSLWKVRMFHRTQVNPHSEKNIRNVRVWSKSMPVLFLNISF